MEKSSTSKAQKIGIWFIIVAMTVGSIGAYFIVIVDTENQKRDAAQQTKIQEQIKKQQEQEDEEVEPVEEPDEESEEDDEEEEIAEEEPIPA